MDLNEYIEKVYNNREYWFQEEVTKQSHRQYKVLDNIEYLDGKHKILNKPNIRRKNGSIMKTKKLVLQTAKSILDFNVSYVVGNPVSFKGTDKMIKLFSKVYRDGGFNTIDFNAVNDVLSLGDSFERIYLDKNPITGKKMIKVKLIKPEDGFPVFTETMDYVAFIEHWISNNVYYYYVYYSERVEYWNNEGGDLHLIETRTNVSGLPIPWNNKDRKENGLFGRPMLEDLKPLVDTLEDMLSKMDDSLYTMSLNPIMTQNGTCLEATGDNDEELSADGYSHIIYLDENGSFDIHSTTLDSATLKLYLDQIKQQLIEIGCMPSVSMGQSNIANISQEVIEVVYQNADNFAKKNKHWILECMRKRLEVIQGLLEEYFGESFSDDDYIDVQLNYNKIINNKELIENLNALEAQGILSKDDVREQIPYVIDIEQTKRRIEEQNKKDTKIVNDETVLNDNKK